MDDRSLLISELQDKIMEKINKGEEITQEEITKETERLKFTDEETDYLLSWLDGNNIQPKLQLDDEDLILDDDGLREDEDDDSIDDVDLDEYTSDADDEKYKEYADIQYVKVNDPVKCISRRSAGYLC